MGGTLRLDKLFVECADGQVGERPAFRRAVGVLVLGTFLSHADLVVRQLEQHQPLCGAETARHKRQGSVFLSLTAEASPAARPPASLDPTATVIAR
jgi:hypothetical protein